MTYFDYKRIAEGYAKSRPQYHLLVMDMLRKDLKLEGMLSKGLDVGCGAGLSTTALRKICENVIGADASVEMIKSACKSADVSGVKFIQCSAENLKFPADTFDIVTVSGAINWINEDIFLPLTKEFLKEDGILLIYDNTMSDCMEGVAEYTKWWHEQYLERFPKPPRKENVWQSEDIQQYGFTILNRVTYHNSMEMSRNKFIDFMVTQSNVIARVEEQGESLHDVRRWFEETLEDIFRGQKRTLIFEGYNWYLKLGS